MSNFRNIRPNGVQLVADAAQRLLLFPSDGYLVEQLNDNSLWAWNSTLATWVAVGGSSGSDPSFGVIQTDTGTYPAASVPTDSVTFTTASTGDYSFGGNALSDTVTLTIQTASGSQTGLLSSADWTTFNSKESALTFSTGLTRSVNTITANLSTGIAGSQSVIGGTAASETLTLSSTSNATKGKILFGTSAYDEVNNRLGIGITAPTQSLDVDGNIKTKYLSKLDLGNVALETSANGLTIKPSQSESGNLSVYSYSATGTRLLTSGGDSAITFPLISSTRQVTAYGADYTSAFRAVGTSAVVLERNAGKFIISADTGLSGSYATFTPTNRMTVDGSTGNVGIGNTSPTATLHVQTAGVGVLLGRMSDVPWGSIGFDLSGLNSGTYAMFGGPGLDVNINSPVANKSLFFNTQGGQRVNINSSGRTFFGGATSATALVHIAAGTATTNTAPLKFTSGTLNTTPAAGTVEFLNESFYVTPTSTARQSLPGVLFTQTADATVANTVTETTLVGTGVGSMTLPANFFVAGKTVRIQMLGYHAATGAPTIRMRVKLGSTVVLDTTAVNSHNTASQQIELDGLITCRTTGVSGTVYSQGQYHELQNTPVDIQMLNTTATTIDTTVSQVVTVTAEWGTADPGNAITSTNLVLEVLN